LEGDHEGVPELIVGEEATIILKPDKACLTQQVPIGQTQVEPSKQGEGIEDEEACEARQDKAEGDKKIMPVSSSVMTAAVWMHGLLLGWIRLPRERIARLYLAVKKK
jgi:hypothetical protein